jgi:hypothetical protein
VDTSNDDDNDDDDKTVFETCTDGSGLGAAANDSAACGAAPCSEY